MIDGARRDFTGLGSSKQMDFLLEQEILPEQIGEHKRKIHLEFLRNHFGTRNINHIWTVREACIAAIIANQEPDGEGMPRT